MSDAYAENYMSKYREFEVRDDDIFITSWPKCGTTWLQNMVYHIVHGFDYIDPAGIKLNDRMPYMEFYKPGIDNINARQGRRIIKTHMPYSLLPPPIQKGKGKLLTIARNPKDVAVSFYHFMRKMKWFDFKDDFHTFMKLYMEDKVNYAPYDKFVEEYWHHRNDENVLFLFFEDMKRDLCGSIRKVAHFLHHELSSDMLERITKHCTFEFMEKDPTVNYTWWDEEGAALKQGKFMRKGEVADWKNYLTQEQSARIEEKYKHLENKGLIFKYEL